MLIFAIPPLRLFRWRRLPHQATRALTIGMMGTAFFFGVGATSSSADEAYKLAAGDRVHVAVIGEQELTGEYTIDGTGTIPFPLIGAVQVAGLTLDETRGRIAFSLSSGFVQQPNVSVRISRLRPIHVLGEVRNPGGYPYEFGSLVKTAIAQAGGFGPREPRATALTEFMAADERVAVLTRTLNRLSIRKARLDAQLKIETTFALPAGLTLPAEVVQQISADEQQALKTNVDELHKQQELLRGQIQQVIKEDSARVAQIAVQKNQAALVQRRIDEYDKLSEKGLGRNNTTLELQLALATQNADVMRLEVDRSRLQINAKEIDFRLQAIESTFKQAVITELNDVRQRLHEAEVTLPMAREQRMARLQIAGTGAIPIEDYIITVTRLDAQGQPVTTRVSGNMRIRPGDLIEVAPPKVSPPTAATSSLPPIAKTSLQQ